MSKVQGWVVQVVLVGVQVVQDRVVQAVLVVFQIQILEFGKLL